MSGLLEREREWLLREVRGGVRNTCLQDRTREGHTSARHVELPVSDLWSGSTESENSRSIEREETHTLITIPHGYT